MTDTALPTGDQRRQAVRAARTVARKLASVVRQLVRRNGPVWLAVRYEVIGVAAWARRRPRAALVGVGLLFLTGLLFGWSTAVLWTLVWWAATRIPRARAERRYLTFKALGTVTRTPTEVRIYQTAQKRPVRPRSRVHVRRWIPLRIRSVPVLPGTVPARGVISYDPKFADDYPGAQRRLVLEKALEQRLRGHRDDIAYRFTWQPGRCRVSFRVQPPLPTGKLAYTHQQTLPWHRLPVGPTHGGRVVTVDLARRPHVILSGATRSGKTSVAMVWLAHLLRFPHVQVVLIDPARLDFHWARDYIDRYACTLRDMTGTLASVYAEAERRMAAYDAVADWRNTPLPHFGGLVLIVEELAVFVRTVERHMGKDTANALRGGILDLAESGGKVNVHVIVIAQQPNADVFDGTEARDQFEWSVLCANPSKEHKTMLSGYGLMIPDLNLPGRVAVIEGQTRLTEAHAFWLASPTTPGVTAEDRTEALRWLPEPEQHAAKTVTATATAVTCEHITGQDTTPDVAGPDDGQNAVIRMTDRKRRRSS